MKSESGNGRVLCSSVGQMADGAILANAIDVFFDKVSERVGYRRNTPAEVWLDSGWGGAPTVFEQCIVINPAEPRIQVFPDLLLAHELVHWHAEGTALQRHLPNTVYEGLAEWIAVDVVPQWEDDRRNQYRSFLKASAERGDLHQLIARIGWDKYRWNALPRGERRYEMYALGFTLVDLIGVDALREAAERGPVSPEMILSMAGVSADGTGLIATGTVGPARMELTKPICIETRFWAADGSILGCVVSELPDSGQVPAGAIRSEVRIVECP